MTAAFVIHEYKSSGFHLNEHANPIPESTVLALDQAANAILQEHYIR